MPNLPLGRACLISSLTSSLPFTKGSKNMPCLDSPRDQAPPAGKSPPPGGQQDVYYANITFLRRQSQEPRDQEATSTTEYSEIKRSKRDLTQDFGLAEEP